MTPNRDAARKYLDPRLISSLKSLPLKARLVIEGFMAGLHKSPYHGFSVEFAEHRQYMPGDDIRNVDWKVYGKTDRYYVKQFEEETNLKSYLLVDQSASMSFASAGISKFSYAIHIAAALSYLLIQQRDAVGLVSFDDAIRKILPARSVPNYLNALLGTLDAARPSEGTNIAATLHDIAERVKRRSLLVLFSDLFDENLAGVLQGLKHFRHRRHEVIVFHIMDPMEIDFAYKDATEFIDMESGDRIATHPLHIREGYKTLLREFLDEIKATCLANRIDYVPLRTDTGFDVALSQYLQKRQRLN